jgi:hypothetical protein
MMMLPGFSAVSWPQIRALVDQGNGAEAIQILLVADSTMPGQRDIQMGLARVYGWNSDFLKADSMLQILSDSPGFDSDVELLRADLNYYQGNWTQARRGYEQILARHPEYLDAADGLKRLKSAYSESSSLSKLSGRDSAVPVPPNWIWMTTAGGEISTFTHRRQSAWNEEFVELVSQSNRQGRTFGAKAMLYHRFDRKNVEFALLATQSMPSGWMGSLGVASSPNQDYRPLYRVDLKGAWVGNWEKSLLPTQFRAQLSQVAYSLADISMGEIKIVFSPTAGWEFHAAGIGVLENSSASAWGGHFRVNGPVFNGIQIQAGYALSPEVESGLAVMTESWLGGLAWSWKQFSARAGLSREDREETYIRKTAYANITYRH